MLSFNCFISGNDNRIHFWCMNEDEVMNLLKNAAVSEKSGAL